MYKVISGGMKEKKLCPCLCLSLPMHNARKKKKLNTGHHKRKNKKTTTGNGPKNLRQKQSFRGPMNFTMEKTRKGPKKPKLNQV